MVTGRLGLWLAHIATVTLLLGGCGGGTGNGPQSTTPAAPTVSLFAGSIDSSGSIDGTGAAVRFVYLTGVTVDGAGNVYVADFGNNTIRKITAGGVVTTLAGTAGVAGWADGVGTTASFYHPNDVAVDAAGDVYVTNIGDTNLRPFPSQGDATVYLSKNFRKISPAGAVTTVAGNQGAGAVAIDGNGNIYTAISETIRKTTPAGVATTLAGSNESQGTADGSGAQARFFAPSSLTVDAAGNVYVTDAGSIRKISPAGVVTTLAGQVNAAPGSADGTGPAASFDNPSGIAVDSAGNLFVSDLDNYVIRKITPVGVVTTLAGKAGVRGSVLGNLPGGLDEVNGVAIDAKGTLYVTTPTAVLKIQQ